MKLTKVRKGQRVQVKAIGGREKDQKFLLSLGCFEGAFITLISTLAGVYVVSIKDSRYALDEELAGSIIVEA